MDYIQLFFETFLKNKVVLFFSIMESTNLWQQVLRQFPLFSQFRIIFTTADKEHIAWVVWTQTSIYINERFQHVSLEEELYVYCIIGLLFQRIILVTTSHITLIAPDMNVFQRRIISVLRQDNPWEPSKMAEIQKLVMEQHDELSVSPAKEQQEPSLYDKLNARFLELCAKHVAEVEGMIAKYFLETKCADSNYHFYTGSMPIAVANHVMDHVKTASRGLLECSYVSDQRLHICLVAPKHSEGN